MQKDKGKYLLVGGAVAVLLLAVAMLSWFSPRVGDRPFEQSQLWFAAAAFVMSGLGLVALVGTFREQRKLTANTSRAYLEVVAARGVQEDQTGFQLTLEIFNNGQTPASELRLEATIFCSGETDALGQGSETADEHSFEGMLDGVPTRAVHSLTTWTGAMVPLPSTQPPGTWRYRGSSVRIKGAIKYLDAFGDGQTLQVNLWRDDLSFNHVTKGFAFWGAHTSMKAEGFPKRDETLSTH